LGGEAGSSSFGRQQQLSEITMEPIKNLEWLGKIWGPVPPGPSLKPPPVNSLLQFDHLLAYNNNKYGYSYYGSGTVGPVTSHALGRTLLHMQQ